MSNDRKRALNVLLRLAEDAEQNPELRMNAAISFLEKDFDPYGHTDSMSVEAEKDDNADDARGPDSPST